MKGKVYRKTKKKSSYVSKGTGRYNYRKRTYKEPKINVLEREVKELTKETNKRLRMLRSAGVLGEYASRSLLNKLGTNKLNMLKYTRKGEVKIPLRIKTIKGLSNVKLKAIKKLTETFLSSLTSTPKGIREKERRTVEGIKTLISDENKKERVNEEDAKTYYDMFFDKDFNALADKIPPSDLWTYIDIAINENYSLNDWLNLIESAITLENDEDLKNSAIKLYEKYID